MRGFLIGSALFWLKHFHADGLRVDAVASMLYRDYSRREGEWITNRYDGRENLEAIDFLQELSRVVAEEAPGATLIAEESTAWPGVTRAADAGGLGFTHKWNMGWMHDTLRYISHEPVHRSYQHDDLTFGLLYAFFERFILAGYFFGREGRRTERRFDAVGIEIKAYARRRTARAAEEWRKAVEHERSLLHGASPLVHKASRWERPLFAQSGRPPQCHSHSKTPPHRGRSRPECTASNSGPLRG